MNFVPYRDIVAALRLTRAGDLVQATAVLQRTLGGLVSADIASDSNIDVEPTAVFGRKIALPAWGPIDREETPESRAEALESIAMKVRQRRAGRTTPSSPAVLETEPSRRFLMLSFSGAAGTRAYKLFIPSTYRGQPCPLIVMLHGCTQSVDDFAAGTRMNELADDMACFVAYPEQSVSANSSKCWNWFTRRNQERDRGEPSLVAGITRKIMKDYRIDPKRVYIAGMSAGAAAAALVAAAYPELYAALGVHSGLACGMAHDVPSAFAAMKTGEPDGRLRGPQQSTTRNRQPVPTILFHGDRDLTVHPRNSDRFAEDVVTTGCAKHVRTGRIPGGHEFTQTSYTDQSGQRIFERWLVHGAGHAWSGGSASGSYTDPQGPDASREMLRFFLAHQHPD